MMFRAILFSPVSLVIMLVLHLRHLLYNVGVLSSKNSEHKLIKVGNLALGGTGKTPFAEYLIKEFKKEFVLGVVSRGYGRENDFLVEVGLSNSTSEVGDEPLQIKKKFPDIPIYLKGDRHKAINALLEKYPRNECIILDDAMQHRKVANGFLVLLTSYDKLFYKDYLFPSGYLRDLRTRAHKANAIVVTKTPSTISEKEERSIRRALSKYNKPVFFVGIDYKTPSHFINGKRSSNDKFKNAVLVSGIARSNDLLAQISQRAEHVEHFKFKDHHEYSEKDFQKIKEKIDEFKGDSVIFTTEKDVQRMRSSPHLDIIKDLPIYTIAIEITFLKQEQEFKTLLRNYVRSN